MDAREKSLYIFCIHIMTEETRTRLFYKLLKLNTKKVRYEHHCDFLAYCKTRDAIPEGLQLHKTANVDSFSDKFDNKWKNVLDGASKEMRDLVYQECQLAIGTITKQIEDLESSVANFYGLQVRDESINKIMDICAKLKASLTKRRRTKMDKLCLSNHSQIEDLIAAETSATETTARSIALTPTNSQIAQFITDIQVEVDNQITSVGIEDLGPEEIFHGANPLSEDESQSLLMNVASTGEVAFTRSLTVEVKNTKSLVLIEDIGTEDNLCGVDPLPVNSHYLLVDLRDNVVRTEEFQNTETDYPNIAVELNEFNTLNESSEGNVTEESRPVIEVAPGVEHMGLGVVDDLAYTEGLHVVVNLSSRTLTEAENSLLSKGLSFCPTPEEIDMFTLRKDIMEYVR